MSGEGTESECSAFCHQPNFIMPARFLSSLNSVVAVVEVVAVALLSVALATSCKLLLSLGSHRMVITSKNGQQAIKNELWIILNLWLGPVCQRPDQRTETRRYTTNVAME